MATSSSQPLVVGCRVCGLVFSSGGIEHYGCHEAVVGIAFCSRPLSGSRTVHGPSAGTGPLFFLCGGWSRVVVFAAVMAQVRRPVPFRTRKLRPGAAMVLHSEGCGRVARRRILFFCVEGEFLKGIPLFSFIHARGLGRPAGVSSVPVQGVPAVSWSPSPFPVRRPADGSL